MVYDLYRFSRKVIEGERLVVAAKQGARVWALAGEYRLTTADGRAAFREAMVKAAAESDKISERVKRGKLRRSRKGKADGGGRTWAMPGWAPRGPGWEKSDPRERVPQGVVDTEREIAKECVERLVAGDAVGSVVRELNRRGAAGEPGCLTVAGGPWSETTLTRTLRRPAMAGLLAFNGTIVGELAGVEPVVEREVWERLCALFDARKTGRPPSPRHLLSGVFRCANCGRPMRGQLRRHQGPYPDGEMRRDYRCRKTNAADPACSRNYTDGRVADEAVAHAVLAKLGDPAHPQRVAEHLARVVEQRGVIEAEIARWEDEADSLAGKTATWGVERVDRSMGPILARIETLRGTLATVDMPDTAHAATADAVGKWNQAQERGDVIALRRLIKSAFPSPALAMPTGRMDHRPERILWYGAEVQ